MSNYSNLYKIFQRFILVLRNVFVIYIGIDKRIKMWSAPKYPEGYPELNYFILYPYPGHHQEYRSQYLLHLDQPRTESKFLLS